jgi:hypothetical protein
MGKAIRNFKRAVAQNENIQVSEIKEDERKRLQDSKTGSEITDAEVIDEKRGA